MDEIGGIEANMDRLEGSDQRMLFCETMFLNNSSWVNCMTHMAEMGNISVEFGVRCKILETTKLQEIWVDEICGINGDNKIARNIGGSIKGGWMASQCWHPPCVC